MTDHPNTEPTPSEVEAAAKVAMVKEIEALRRKLNAQYGKNAALRQENERLRKFIWQVHHPTGAATGQALEEQSR